MQPTYEQPVADYVRFHAVRDPDAVAFIDGSERCTYGDLDLRTNRVANALIFEGCGEGDRIAFLGVNSAAYVETFFGATKAKVTYVGVNWRLAPTELEYILNDAGVKLVVSDPDFVPVLEGLKARLPTLQTIVSTDSSAFCQWRDGHSSDDPNLQHHAEDPILQFYTSGTTGNPKGVVISNRSMAEHRKSEDQFGDWYLQSEPREVSINAMPNFHIGGLGWLLIGIFRGAKIILMSMPAPKAFLDFIEQESVTHLFAVPVILGMMLDEQKQQARNLSSLQVIHYGASAMAPAMLKEVIQVMGVKFVQYYGMTEANGVISYLPPESHSLDRPELLKSCGRPVPGTQIKVCDQDGKEVERGQPGEFWARSNGLMSEYWNLPEATEAAFSDGWYKTGDGGRMDEEGFIYIGDRIKDMVISGGENIYPAEVENALFEHPAIAEAAVVGVADDRWGESLKAFVVFNAAQSASDDEIIDFLRDRLAGYKIPRQYQSIAELPRTASGKLQKFKLRD